MLRMPTLTRASFQLRDRGSARWRSRHSTVWPTHSSPAMLMLSVASGTPGDAAAAQGLRQSTRYHTSPSCPGQRPGLIQRSGSVTGTQTDGGSAVGGPAEGASSWLRCRMCTPSPRAACTPVMRGAQPAPAWVDEAGAWPAAWGEAGAAADVSAHAIALARQAKAHSSSQRRVGRYPHRPPASGPADDRPTASATSTEVLPKWPSKRFTVKRGAVSARQTGAGGSLDVRVRLGGTAPRRTAHAGPAGRSCLRCRVAPARPMPDVTPAAPAGALR